MPVPSEATDEGLPDRLRDLIAIRAGFLKVQDTWLLLDAAAEIERLRGALAASGATEEPRAGYPLERCSRCDGTGFDRATGAPCYDGSEP